MTLFDNKVAVSSDRIEGKIYYLIGKRVMLDKYLARLYRVSTSALNQAVKRNIKRFPSDFMFRLNVGEMKIWISQIVISGEANFRQKIGIRRSPYVFTEQGVAMLSSVLKSAMAIQVNIQIIRTFAKIRELVASNKELREKIEKLENKYDAQFKQVFEVIKSLLMTDEPLLPPPTQEIGFKPE
ncbi:ORF6N domain-containing protein [Candidatus Uhrbacteria bacterium]|nr:ORF6N domain-containing protein [Candidatus Uhrbacteria bacterium]